MEIINESKEKLELEYPCMWRYKLIGLEEEDIHTAIKEVILEREHKLEHSNASKSGKYISFNLDMLVNSDDERTYIYEALKAHTNIKMVL